MARALAATILVALLFVSGAGGSPALTPKRGGTVVLGPRPEPACLNPFACNVGHNDPAVTQVLEGAFETGPDLVARPNLVSRVDIVSRKPFVLVYHIRPQARWSDGRPVTASDFRFSQDKFATLPLGVDGSGANPPHSKLYRKVRRVRVLDAQTFRVELRERFAEWRELYAIVLPRHALAGVDLTKVWIDRIDNPKTGGRIGSGPFLVERWERGKQLTLVRNPRYWGPHTAYLDRFVFRFDFDPRDPFGQLRRNELDVSLSVGRAFLSAVDAREVRRIPGWRVAAWPAPAAEHFVFRVRPAGHPALESKLVRRAIAYGIDRVAIARAVRADVPERARRPLDSTVFLASERFYRPNWSRYRYDPARARRLLEQAGCRRGSDGVYLCFGERLSLRFFTTAGDPLRERTLRLAQEQLRSAGVEVRPTFAPGGAFFAQLVPSGEFDAALFAWLPPTGGAAWPESRCGDDRNWAGFCSRLIMRDVQQTDFIVDRQQRARVLNAADAKLAGAVPVLPVVQPLLRAALRTTVRGVVPGGSQFNWTQNTEDWWLER